MTTTHASPTAPLLDDAASARRLEPLPARPTSVLMCEPTHFEVSYAINPWMDPTTPVSTDRAVAQWQRLRQTYLDLGFDVETITPIAGLPDMVYAANGAFVLDGIAYGAKFHFAERAAEGPAYLDRLADLGFATRPARHVNEGEGDFLIVDDTILAGHGFRTSLEAHDEVRAIFDREVVSLRLVDPRYYHLDTAMSVVGRSFAWLPAAFDEPSQALVRARWPEALEVDADEAATLGLNTFADGSHLVMGDGAPRFASALRDLGHEVTELDLSELLRAGGSVKCCTLELRR